MPSSHTQWIIVPSSVRQISWYKACGTSTMKRRTMYPAKRSICGLASGTSIMERRTIVIRAISNPARRTIYGCACGTSTIELRTRVNRARRMYPARRKNVRPVEDLFRFEEPNRYINLLEKITGQNGSDLGELSGSKDHSLEERIIIPTKIGKLDPLT